MDQAESLRQLIAAAPPSPNGASVGSGAAAAPARNGQTGGLRVIAVTSGKGGVGKTNISANLAVLAARSGRRVLVIDADLGLANVEIVFGVKPSYHIGDLIDGRLSIEEVLCQGPHGVKILPAGSGLPSLTQLTDLQKHRLMEVLERVQELFDLVIVDSGAGIGDNVMFFVGGAQEAVLVISPEPTSLVDAYAVVKVLSQQAGVKHFGVVVNPVVDEMTAREIFPKLTTVTSRFLNARVRHLGYVPRDENLHRAIVAQTPVVDLFPLSPASRAIAAVADRLFGQPAPAGVDGGLKFMWNRLLREASVVGG